MLVFVSVLFCLVLALCAELGEAASFQALRRTMHVAASIFDLMDNISAVPACSTECICTFWLRWLSGLMLSPDNSHCFCATAQQKCIPR